MSKKSESASRGDSLDAEMTSLKVAVRVRPLNDKEINVGSKIVVDVHGNDIVITDLKVPEHQGYDHRSRVHKFSFDYGFSSVNPKSVQYASQATVFENFGRVVLQALLEGYNCCVIAYGQSGSGKTYTMMGMKDEEGLTPRICEGLLMKLEDKAKQNISFAVNISYMEIYNEQVYDLLQKADERTNLSKPRLRVREHPIHGPFVEGLSTHVLRSRDNVCQLISEGNDNRIKAATYIHDRSSRSHAIFTVHCSQACLDESQPKEVVSKLQLVDLAGSEKAGHEFCQSRLKEGASINKSLVTLGNVISALVELSQRSQNGSTKGGGKQLFVPYRDSQLTWLMKDSLGGNSHTFMLAAVSPSNECYLETLSTLRYAQRAKSVLSTPIVNEDPATKIIRNLRLEVNKLKSLLINADVLSKKAIIEPLSNISHLNSIMKKSEKKVDHLTRCWFEKWLETYNTVLKKTCYMNEGSSTVTKGTGVLQKESTVSNSTAEKIDTTPQECDISLYSGGAQCGSPVKLKAGDSDAILSDKSSSVSSECIILPNETIFYSKGKRINGHHNYFKDCASYFKSASLNHMSDSRCEISTPPDKCVKDSSNPEFHFYSTSLSDVSYYKNTLKSPPVLNSVSAPNVHSPVSLQGSLLTSFSLPKGIQPVLESTKTTKESETKDTDFLESSVGTNSCFEKTCEEKKTCGSSQVITPTDNHLDDFSICEEDAEVKSGLNNNEVSQHEIRSDISEGFANTSDICGIQTDNKTLLADGSERKDCTNGFIASHSSIDDYSICEANAEVKSSLNGNELYQHEIRSDNSEGFSNTSDICRIQTDIILVANGRERKDCTNGFIAPNSPANDYSICEADAEVKHGLNSNEFSQHEIRSDISKGFANISGICTIQTVDETLQSDGNKQNNCISASDSLTDCMINTTDKVHSCREVEFNDSVTEESDNFVKFLNRLQDGSVETISHCFQRKDSEILSLLSLSSNDYPPFHSLDDIFNDDDMEVPDEGSDGLCEDKGDFMRKSWDEIHSSSDVSDLSDSSDAESEFDYLDFTKNATGTCSAKEICFDSSAITAPDEKQNLQNSEFLRHINRCKENMLSIPENATVPQMMIKAEASAPDASYQTENKYFDVYGDDTTVTTECEKELRSENSVYTEELSPLMCTNVHTDNFSALCNKNLTSNSRHHTNESVNTMKTPNNKKVENFTSYAQKNCVLQKRLCTSDSILKTLATSETKHSSKSDNIVYITPEQCSTTPEISAGSNRRRSCENVVNSDSITKTPLRNKDSISDLLGFSVQDILDMINSKNPVQCGAVLKKQIHPVSEDKLQYDNAIPEEIQRFIDSTEITDANKLADELLKKKLPQCSTSVTPTSNDSVLTNNSNQNKLPSKSKLCSPHSDDESAGGMYGEKSGYQNLDTDMCALNQLETEKINMEMRVSDIEKSSGVTLNAHVMDGTHKIDNMKCIEEIKENGRLKYDKLHMAVQKVHCERENALEYFTLNGCKDMLLGSLSDESDYLDSASDSINDSKTLPKSQQISVASGKSVASEIMPSPHSVEIDAVQCTSNFQNLLTESPDNNITDSNSQTKIFTEYSTFGNLNITGLTPIQEEAADEDDDAVSEASEDDSPNISFQFDSLERPKNMSVVKKDLTCVEQSCTTDNKDNTEELRKYDNLSNVLNDVSKLYYNKNYDFPAETEKQDQNKELSDLNFKCIEMSKETVNPKDMLKLCSASSFEENLTKFSDTCGLAAEFQKCPSSFITEHCNKCNVIGKETNKNAESPKNDLKLKVNNSNEVNNYPNQFCSWDSLSSSTSSDSITFVFVGKENKSAMSGTNSRSFQSSLFSSVSLDSLEKSSVHQNQVACASPRTLSIDSLVAEELLFQLRNSDPVHPLISELKQDAGNKCELNNAVLIDQKLAPQTTNFAATSQLSSNQHLKMYHHMHCNVENGIFAHGATSEILGMDICEKQNAVCDATRNQIVTYHSNTFPSRKYCGNKSDNTFQNLRENYSCISPESNGDDAAEQTGSYLKTVNSREHHIAANASCNISNDCNSENISSNICMYEMQKCIPEENVFNTCTNGSITASHFDCVEFGNGYDLDLQSNSSNVALDNCNVVTDDKSLEPLILDNYGVMQKQIYSPETTCSKSNSFCNNCTTNDCNELISVKELTEENLKQFNSEFEENQEENFIILPPPSTFGGSEDNGLSVISNCSSSSLANNQSKASVDVFSKSTQTDQNIQNECSMLGENNAVMDSGNTDLIERMMDLMAETLKLIKEQYSKTPKRSHSHTRRKLNFSTDSDKNTADLKQKTVVPHTTSKHRKYLSKERTADTKVLKYIQSVLPPDSESDYAIDKFSHPLTHSELTPYPQKTANEKRVNTRSRVINHGDQRTGCAMGKQPNFYTLPFDFITCKYQCKKLSNASEQKKPDTFSQTSVNYLPDNAKNMNLVSNELDNVSAFKSASAKEHKVPGINEMAILKQSLPMPGTSKSHLNHLIELRRQVVEATTASPNVRENLNSGSQVTDPLKSSSSSSEGYLSSVSSRGPIRHFSEASTDSQELSCTAEHLFQRQCFPKHNVKPLDFSTQCDRDVAVSPDMRWLNTSADSGAFFLDSPGTEKKANLDEYPMTTAHKEATLSAACSSPKRPETRSPLHCNDTVTASISPQEAKVPSLSRFKWDEIKNGRRQHEKTDFAPGFQELDEIGENYLGISLRKSVSVNSSTSSDLSFCTGKSLKNRNPKSSRTPRNSPKLKHVSSEEIQRLLESIEKDRRLLQQIQHNYVFDKKYLPSPNLPSCSSLEITDDLFYQDTYKSLPSPHGCLHSFASHKV